MTKSRLLIASLLLIVLSCSSDEDNPTSPTGQNPDPEPRSLTIPTAGYMSPNTYEGMDLVWSDEFDGTELNMSDWNFEIGNGRNGWGNLEAQYYTKENTSLVDGNLVIEARRETVGASNYTSSRITTEAKQEFQYGRIDVRAVMPSGNGMWPAIWMLGANFAEVGWPRSGEIDIMEMLGEQGDSKVYGTVHWDNAGSNADFGGTTSLDSGTLNDEYHVYSIVWDETFITWYIDDKQFHAIDISPDGLEEFRNKFFFILNVAVGGDKGAGDPANTPFPQWMIVDYIRVFQ